MQEEGEGEGEGEGAGRGKWTRKKTITNRRTKKEGSRENGQKEEERSSQ